MRHHYPGFSFISTAAIILLLATGSCKTPQTKLSQYGPVFPEVMLSDTGAFRGHNLGDRIESVRKSENKPVEEDSSFLYYEYKLADSSGSFNVTYDFDDNGLNEIQADIFIRNPNLTDTVFAAFRKFFDEHYGKSEEHMGFNVWTVPSEKYGNVRINLSDESSDFTTPNSPGKISLWVYPDKD